MPLTVSFTVWAMVAFLVLFFGVGAVMAVRAYLSARRAHPGTPVSRTLRGRIDAYVGPVPRQSARLNLPLRVLVEFACALFGFAGLGWALSTRIMTGLVLMLGAPAFWWFVWPILLDKAGILAHHVLYLVVPLPLFAACSAVALAVAELRPVRSSSRQAGTPAEADDLGDLGGQHG